MPSIRDLISRREAIRAELRDILDKHPDGALPDETRARADALEAEALRVTDAERRQAMLDDLDRRAAGQPVNGTGDANLDREMRSFSLVRAIASQVPNLNVDAGRERELSQEVARRAGRSFMGMAVPMSVFHQPVEQRVITSTAPAAGPGSNLIATDYRPGEYIDLLRNALVVRQLGARVLSGLVGNVAIPRLKEDATAAWVNENQAIPTSDMAFGQVSLTPKHVGARTEFSRNMLLQSSPDIETLVRADFAAVLAAEVDRAAINGSGVAPEPLGVLNTPGIGSVSLGTNGGVLTFDAVADLQGMVDDANVTGASMAFVTNTRVRRQAAKMKDTTNVPLGLSTVFQGGMLAVTNNVPSALTKGTGTNLSALIYGNWSDLLLGYWSEFDLLVNPFESVAYSKGNVQVRGMVSMDATVRYAQSFAAIRDIAA
ncbi:phage major capsid protein [Roseomonas sp. KE0001]|uniref:phage major capsid protein n=1 Tax=Roseomonas sp. KE0001 TaxID=2479201 RepID=UPI0018E04EE9|nr:phage major capsid protein [Roseomonas sp. KE0001]MBI0432810.1 phage major capsid protein [Roseomonas sp. KE0001]